MKKCSKCGLEKDLEKFYKNKAKPDGRSGYCGLCHNQSGREYRERNLDKEKARGKKYRVAHPRKKQNLTQDQREYRRLYEAEYRRNNSEKEKARAKRYYESHKQESLARQRKNLAKKRQTLKGRIENSLRSRISKLLRGTTRSLRSMELVGCSIEDLKKHIESLWKQEMTWDNYGLKGWHIDHIIPCSSFDFSNVEQQKQCFHFSNLQPLWAKENHHKSDKVQDGERQETIPLP